MGTITNPARGSSHHQHPAKRPNESFRRGTQTEAVRFSSQSFKKRFYRGVNGIGGSQTINARSALTAR
jgi:hypothetical protein